MNLDAPCRNFSRARLRPVQEFLREHPHLLASLPGSRQNAFITICGAIAHLRSKKARDFFIQIHRDIASLNGDPHNNRFLGYAASLSASNWALVQPYFKAIKAVSQEPPLIEPWFFLALHLASLDIDVAVTFLDLTPKAMESLGKENLLLWGGQALEALQTERRTWQAAKAYLDEAVADRCATPLLRWRFFLDQAARVSQVSPVAAKEFITLGARVCSLLNDEETVRWVAQGLESSRSEGELLSYFSGTALKALEIRDGLASGVALKERANTLALICEAFLGTPVKIRPNTSLAGVKDFTGSAATDGRTIYLPEAAASFEVLKLMALHQSLLLEDAEWQHQIEQGSAHSVRIHLDADRRLLQRLPGLRADMNQVSGYRLNPAYPSDSTTGILGDHIPPWWGDLLPKLMTETGATLQQLKDRASEDYELPPEVVEAILAAMMAEGQRDAGLLWEQFKEMLGGIELTSPDIEELHESVKTRLYREWDEDLFDYKLDWCMVRQRWADDAVNGFAEEVTTRLHGLVALIRRQFTRMKPEQFKRFRDQPAGDDLDIDALVNAFVDMRSGSFLSENVYIRRDKRIRDVAVLFLLDLSGSTAEMVNGRRVIDIQKESMVLMAEALESLGDPYGIFGFTSEGRFRVDVFTVKDFGDPYNDRARYRLGNLEPKGLTRLGAVIRHGAYKLEGLPAAIKLMIILTDGRPYDLDYGGLDYAIADTKKAVQEARRKRIHPFTITFDKKGASYLNRISPHTQSIILPKAELLPTLLPALYKRLTV